MRIETKTYRFEASDLFSGKQAEFEGGSIWHAEANRTVQVPIFNFALSEVCDITEEYGDEDYGAAVLQYFDIKRPHVVSKEDRTEEIAGHLARVRDSISKRTEGGAQKEVFHLFVNIQLDDEFMQEFSADCPLDARETYEPLFWAAIRSVEFTGDRRAAIDIQEAARTEMYARMDLLAAKAEALAAGAGSSDDEPERPEPGPFAAPTDGRPVMKVAGFSFAIDGEETEWSVASFSHALCVTVQGKADDAGATEKEGLTSDYPGDGVVKLSIAFSGVYTGGGVPRGVFRFEDGSCKEPYLSVDFDGVDYGLKFSGNVTLQDGWVGFQGSLGRSYDTDEPFGVDIRVRFDPAQLDWSQYQFSTLEEIEAAPADGIRFVSFHKVELDELPKEILAATNLEQLSLWRRAPWGDESSPPSLDFPKAFVELTRLKELHIANYGVAELPDLSRLSDLTKVYLVGVGLRTVPEGLMTLPRLRFLSLSDNELATMPAEVDLPSLESIDVSENKLRSLPEALFQQPNLARLDLQENPWESLPDACNHFTVSLSLEDKQRLLDFTYKGADGLGTVSWDDGMFHLAGAPGQSEESARLGAGLGRVLADVLKELPEGPELAGRKVAVHFLAARAVHFQHAGEEDYSTVGSHRFGGMPDLPPGISYPRHGTNWRDDKSDYVYEFIGQVNLEHIAPLQDYLPRKGMLYFFLTTIHDLYDGDGGTGPKVIYYPGDSSPEALVSGKSLQFDEDDYSEMTGPCYEGFKVEASAAVSVPSLYAAGQNPHLFRGVAEAIKGDDEFLDELSMDLLEEPLSSRFPHEYAIGGYCFSQHEHPELQAALAFKGAPEDWVVLLKVTSSGDFQWGDAGDLFYVIHKSDLAKGDFSKVYCGLESS